MGTVWCQIEDLQLSVSRMEKEHGRREDILRQEISDLQQVGPTLGCITLSVQLICIYYLFSNLQVLVQ